MDLEKALRRKAEAKKEADIKESLTENAEKSQKLEALLKKLQAVHEKASGEVKGAKEQRASFNRATKSIEKLFENEEFGAILREEGIESVDDLVSSEEYGELDQVKEVKELSETEPEKRKSARESVEERRATKKEALEAIQEEDPDAQKLTYKDIVSGLEGLIEKLKVEQQELHTKTPEGQIEDAKRAYDELNKKLSKFTNQEGQRRIDAIEKRLDRLGQVRKLVDGELKNRLKKSLEIADQATELGREYEKLHHELTLKEEELKEEQKKERPGFVASIFGASKRRQEKLEALNRERSAIRNRMPEVYLQFNALRERIKNDLFRYQIEIGNKTITSDELFNIKLEKTDPNLEAVALDLQRFEQLSSRGMSIIDDIKLPGLDAEDRDFYDEYQILRQELQVAYRHYNDLLNAKDKKAA